jgi:peroxiredoxin
MTAAVVLAAAARADEADPFAIPNGKPPELVAFILRMVQLQPRDAEMQAKRVKAITRAADKVIASHPGAQELYSAIYWKTAALPPKEAAEFEAGWRRSGDVLAAQTAHARILIDQLDTAKSDPEALRKKLDEVQKFLNAPPLGPGATALAEIAGQQCEKLDDDKLTRRYYKSFLHSLDTMPGAQGTPGYLKMRAALRRLELPGHDMELEGKTIDGKTFKLAQWRGKVVLVDFWTTSCPACMAAMEDIKDAYKKYHDKGLEVVGISVDDVDSKQLADFVKEKEMPWTICRDKDNMRSMGSLYGVTSIPVLILVGRDGKVLSINAQASEMSSLVEQALAGTLVVTPEPEEKVASNDPAELKKEKAKAEKAKQREKEKAEELAAQEKKKKRQEALAARAPKFRTWSDTSGSFHTTAKFRGVVAGKVRLEREDGTVISVPLDKLSDEDQQYIRDRKH